MNEPAKTRKPITTFGLALLAGFAGAGIGWLLTSMAAHAILTLGGVKHAISVAGLLFGPLGSLAGLVIGLRMTLPFRSPVVVNSIMLFMVLLAALAWLRYCDFRMP